MQTTLDLPYTAGACAAREWTVYDPVEDVYWSYGRWARDCSAAERYATWSEGARVVRSLKAMGRAHEGTLCQRTRQGRLFC